MTSTPRLHVVTDDAVLSRDGWVRSATALIEVGGPTLALHVRGPATTGAVLYDRAQGLVSWARRTGAWLIVNDRVDVAVVVDADGVHLGERSLSISQTRELLGENKRVGVSRHSSAAVGRARDQGADYTFVGTIFPTPSHEGVQGMGLEGLRDAVESGQGMPVVGIGGIGVDDVGPVLDTGAIGVAVVRGVWDSRDPAAAAAEYLSAIESRIDD